MSLTEDNVRVMLTQFMQEETFVSRVESITNRLIERKISIFWTFFIAFATMVGGMGIYIFLALTATVQQIQQSNAEIQKTIAVFSTTLQVIDERSRESAQDIKNFIR